MLPSAATYRDHWGKGTQMRKGAILVTVLSVVFSWSSLAGAKSFEMGAKLGYSIPTGNFADSSDEGVAWGIFANYLITSNAAMQVSLVRHSHNVSVSEPNDILASLGQEQLEDFASIYSAGITMQEAVLNGKYTFMSGKIRPYVVAGGGLYVWDINVDGNEPGYTVSESVGTDNSRPVTDRTETDTIGDEINRDSTYVDLGLNAGLGITFMLTGELSFGVEAMYARIFGNFDEGFVNLTGTLTYGF